MRALYYNGPDVARQDQWSEVQLPVRRKAGAGAPKEPIAAPSE